MHGCNIRALWILNNSDTVVFSRRFSVVERQWRISCEREFKDSENDLSSYFLRSRLPTDAEITNAFIDRKMREGSVRGYGVRSASSEKGLDSWVDDPITRYIISLKIDTKDGKTSPFLLWPFILHIKGQYRILILPLVEPYQLAAYERICQRDDCGNPSEVNANGPIRGSLSYLMLELPCITGAFLVAQSLADLVMGEYIEPEIVIPPPSGGLLDSLTGSMGIASIGTRAKPVGVSPATTPTATSASSGSATADIGSGKTSSKAVDKDSLRSFISSAMPFGTPLDLGIGNITTMRLTGFSATDVPHGDLKQPAWKPYLFKGKQRILFMIHEVITAAMYDSDDVPDTISISGQINCRADLEGLPDVSLPLSGLNAAHIEALSFHPCAQVPEQGVDKQTLIFSPPLGNFILLRYQAALGNLGPPIKGFYQLSMVSEDEGAFLFKLKLMEGYKSPFTMEFCTVTIPFPQRRIILVDGNPSIGTVLTTEHSVEWKIVVVGRSISAKSLEASFSGTIKFASRRASTHRSSSKPNLLQEVSIQGRIDTEGEDLNGLNEVEILDRKANEGLNAAELEEPFCWDANDYARVTFKLFGGSSSGMSIDPKAVTVYPTVKVPYDISAQVISGDYILWNSLGRYPYAASPEV